MKHIMKHSIKTAQSTIGTSKFAVCVQSVLKYLYHVKHLIRNHLKHFMKHTTTSTSWSTRHECTVEMLVDRQMMCSISLWPSLVGFITNCQNITVPTDEGMSLSLSVSLLCLPISLYLSISLSRLLLSSVMNHRMKHASHSQHSTLGCYHHVLYCLFLLFLDISNFCRCMYFHIF